MSKDKYIKYTCPTCGSNAKILGENPDTCEFCSKVICPKCGKLLICPECKNNLKDSQLNRLEEAVKAAERSKKFGIALSIAGLVLMVPIMYFTGSWVIVIVALCCLPIGSIGNTIRISGKIGDILEEIRHENSDFNNDFDLNIRMKVGKIE